ncbi:IS110 family transposase [Trichonephila clavata]|uniref:IS110 family transposase n=1 Tax=Trichonephila clavata TaxID=2740835 RepID=A0A8X6GN51_TRICU|nr:IS110 family transposase [Trichonephila clavata]
MKYYSGLDVSLKETFISIVDEKGKIVKEEVVASESDAIAKCLLDQDKRYEVIGIESGQLSISMCKELRSFGLPVVCVDARHMAAALSARINKNDKNDARGIAQMMRVGLYKEVLVKSDESCQIKVALGSRRQLICSKQQIVGTIRGLLKIHGIKLGKRSKFETFALRIQETINNVDEISRSSIEALLHSLKTIEESIRKLDKILSEQGRKDEDCKLLTTVPGVGVIVAMTYKAAIDDPYRFETSYTVGAYMGLSPRQYASGEVDRHGSISKMGPMECRIVGNTRKFNIDLSKLPDKILSDLEGISCTDIQQSNFVSKINKVKKPGGAMSSPSRDTREKSINFGEGLDRIYDTKPASNQADYPEWLNPFTSGLQKIKLSARESKELSRLKSAIITAKNPIELNKVVDEAIAAGMRMNGCHEGGRSFAEYVILGMHFHKFKKGDQKKIISKLMLSGAEFDTLLKNELVGEIYKELQPEVQPQINKQLEERRKAGENAVQGGSIVGMEMDNDTSLWEFSEGSTVEVAKALEGTGANRGLGSNIIKIGDGEIEIRNEEGGKRNYIDISGRFEIGFPTSIGKLRIAVYNDEKQVQVRVVDKEMWFKLQTKGEEVAKDCLFGE